MGVGHAAECPGLSGDGICWLLTIHGFVPFCPVEAFVGMQGILMHSLHCLHVRISSLQAFVDVLTSYCSDPRELAEVRASEAALRAQVEQLKRALQEAGAAAGGDGAGAGAGGGCLVAGLAQLGAAERGAKQQLELLAVERDEARQQASIYHCNMCYTRMGFVRGIC